MRKIQLCFRAILLTGFIMSSSASAQDGFDMGSEVYYFNYEEPGYMEDKGVFFGINAVYNHHFAESAENLESAVKGAMLRWDGRIAWGQVDYSSDISGEIDNIFDFVLETRVSAGYDFPMSEDNAATPYIGLGYRYLYDDTSGKVSSNNAAGYQRESNYFYLPIGVDFHGPVNDRWSFNVNTEVDVFLYGKQKSFLGDAISGLNTVSNDQNNGIGARGSVSLTRLGDKYTITVEPFIRFWHVDDSDISAVTYNGVVVGYGLEPENETIETGLKVNIKI